MLSFKSTSSYKLFLLAAIGLTMAGCAHKYQPKPLTTLGANNNPNGITVLAEELTPNDCAHYFSKRVSQKTVDMVPVQITIHNKTTETYEFKANDLSLPVVNRGTLAHRVHYHTGKRAMMWGIPAVSIFPFFFDTMLAIPVLLIFPFIFNIPSMADISKAHSTNNKIDSDFEARIISDDSVVQIKPNNTVAKVFFVPVSAYEAELTLKLINANTGKTEAFALDLHPEK